MYSLLPLIFCLLLGTYAAMWHMVLHTAVKEFFFLKVTWKREIKAPLHFVILCSKINKFMYIAHVDINDYIT